MASQRITNTDRDTIARALRDHTFLKQEKALAEREQALFPKAVATTLKTPQDRKTWEAALKFSRDYIRYHNRISVNAGGYNIYLCVPVEQALPIPGCKEYTPNFNIPFEEQELINALQKLTQDREILKKNREGFYQKTYALLTKCSTMKAVFAALPGSEELLEKYNIRDKEASKPLLPVVQGKEIMAQVLAA